jgi:hypothetical protein
MRFGLTCELFQSRRNKMGALHNFTKGGGFDFSHPATITGLTIAGIGVVLIILLIIYIVKKERD